MHKQTISAVILTKNEEKNIQRCIASLGWCNEIVIIDDFSKDKTIEKLFHLRGVPQAQHHLGGGIYKRHLEGNFAQQRNFGLEKASRDWILFVDADEEISEALASEIKSQISNLKSQNQNLKPKSDLINGFYIKRKDYFLGKWLKYGETANVKLLRFGRKGQGKWDGRVHEVWKIEGKPAEFKNPILHYPHQTVSEFLKDLNYYTDLVVQCWKEEGRKISFWEIPVYPVGKFIQNYLLRLGFLDGAQGLIMAIFMSFHSFLAKSKYWLSRHP